MPYIAYQVGFSIGVQITIFWIFLFQQKLKYQ
jgi:hypothetical protein